MTEATPPSSYVFSFKVVGQPIRDMAIPGEKRWFVAFRTTPDGLANLSHHLTRGEAHDEFYRLMTDSTIVSIGLWEQVCLETWRR